MNMKKLLHWLSAIFFCCLVIFLYQNRKGEPEEKVVETQEEFAPEEKSIPAKERFSIVRMSDLADSSKEEIVDANGNELMIGALYLQSKKDLKLYPISDTLGIYQEVEYALAIDNKEMANIKVRGNNGFFFIQGLVLLPGGKEVILDSSNHYQMVMNY